MPEQWTIESPVTQEIHPDPDPVRGVQIGVVAGRVDIVCHEDPAEQGAVLEVHELSGRPLTVDWTGGVLHVNHVRPEGLSGWWRMLKGWNEDGHTARAHVSIAVPRHASVDVGTVCAETVVTGSRAAVKVATVSGETTIGEVHGNVAVETVSGPVDVTDVHGGLKVTSVSGGLTAARCLLDPVSLETVSGALVLDLLGDRAQVRSRSVSGDLTVRIPGDAGYEIAADTTSGRTVLDGQSFGGHPGQRSGRRTEGDAAIALKLGSVSGNITVLRAHAPDVALQRVGE